MDFLRKNEVGKCYCFLACGLGWWGFAASPPWGDSFFFLWFSIEQEPWKIAPFGYCERVGVHVAGKARLRVQPHLIGAPRLPLTTPSMYASLHCNVASASPDWLIVSSPVQASSPLNTPSILTLLSTVSLPSKQLPRPMIVLSACPLLAVEAPFFLLLSILYPNLVARFHGPPLAAIFGIYNYNPALGESTSNAPRQLATRFLRKACRALRISLLLL